MGSATAVKHDNLHVAVHLVDAVGQRSCGRLVDDAAHLEAGDFARFFGSLTLGVVEVGRNRNHRLVHRRSEVVFSSLLHFLKNHSRNLLWRVGAVVNLNARGVVVALHYLVRNAADFPLTVGEGLAHKALNRKDRFGGIGDRLALCGVAHFALATIHKPDYRGRRALTF